MTQRLWLRSIADVTREIQVKLQTKVIDLLVVEVVAGEDEGRDEVGVAQPRSAAAAREESEHVAHDVREGRGSVGGTREHRGTVGGQMKTGSILGTWVSSVFPFRPPVLHEGQLQGLDCVAVHRRGPNNVLSTGGRAAGGEGTSRAATTDRGSTVGIRD